MRHPTLILCTFLFVLAAGYIQVSSVLAHASDNALTMRMGHSFRAFPAESTQLLLVFGKASTSTSAEIHAFEMHRGRWVPSLLPIDAVVGRNGFAEPGEKKEGDGRTPSGVYPLELAFGYARTAATKMPYRQATEGDIWVDDQDSPDYNRWTRSGETGALSFEVLRRNDDAYKLAVVIGYNTNPVVKGRGSAIFLHLWGKQREPTSGCVATAERDLVQVLKWLDPQKKPLIVMGTEKYVSSLRK
jgi:L,D-peptidoglycan transpeptidase YkuD (ErfK/YbiS/YcfS/YnhG family)